MVGNDLGPPGRELPLALTWRRSRTVVLGMFMAIFLSYMYERADQQTVDYHIQRATQVLHGVGLKISIYLPEVVNVWFREFHKTDAVKNSPKSEKKKNRNENYDFLKGPSSSKRLKMFTDEDIKYVEGGRLYLILIGHVFDVSNGGEEYYKPGTGYHGFIGRDSSRAFVSGNFQEDGLVGNLDGLEPNDYKGLVDWLKFYVSHETYKFVGYHVGRYYNADRSETEELGNLKEWIANGMEDLEKEGDLLKLFPSCNVQWNHETGSEVWCSSKSGGIDRDWVGFPRKFFEAGKQSRCSCVHPNFLADPRVKEYESCASNSTRCKIPETDK